MLQPAKTRTIHTHRWDGQRGLATHRRRVIRVLIVDEHLSDVDQCLQELKKAQFAIAADVVQSPEHFTEKLQEHAYDVVLSDTALPNWTGLQALALLQEQQQEIPFILVTKLLTTEFADEFMKKGASDCVDKTRLVRLPLAVAIAVERTSLHVEQIRVEKMLSHSEAHYRALTENPAYGICRFDPDGHFLEVNEAMVTMLGYSSKDELMAVNLANDIIHDPAERDQLFAPFRQTGRVDLMEVEWSRKDGSPMRVRLSGLRVGDEEGSSDGCQVIAEDVTAQRASEDNLRQLAATDALTGLGNYRRLCEALEFEIKRSERTKRAFAVLIFDLDGLKQINDKFGHLTGNRALCRLAEIFRFSCRSIDTAVRYGGDEFAIVLPETGAKDASQVGHRICERLANEREEPRLSVSVGVAVDPEDGTTIETLMQSADRALYKMKHHEKSISAHSH